VSGHRTISPSVLFLSFPKGATLLFTGLQLGASLYLLVVYFDGGSQGRDLRLEAGSLYGSAVAFVTLLCVELALLLPVVVLIAQLLHFHTVLLRRRQTTYEFVTGVKTAPVRRKKASSTGPPSASSKPVPSRKAKAEPSAEATAAAARKAAEAKAKAAAEEGGRGDVEVRPLLTPRVARTVVTQLPLTLVCSVCPAARDGRDREARRHHVRREAAGRFPERGRMPWWV
jgi:hypothetical protein